MVWFNGSVCGLYHKVSLARRGRFFKKIAARMPVWGSKNHVFGLRFNVFYRVLAHMIQVYIEKIDWRAMPGVFLHSPIRAK